jgi:hypothetical protein
MGVKQQARDAVWEQPDAELVCILCGSTVGDVFGQRVVHHKGCERPLPWFGGRPRCCHCGGALICDPTTDIWGAGRLPLPSDQDRLRDAVLG